MKPNTIQAVVGSAALLLAQPALGSHAHRNAHIHYGKRHLHQHVAEDAVNVEDTVNVTRRDSGTYCKLPSHPDLVSVPGAKNGGFAIPGDRYCSAGDWCPIACVSGKVMAQWKPGTKYAYPESQYGGLYCDDGKPVKAFDSSPYCVDGTGTVKAVNKCGKVVSFCQTVLPGDESMVIPTDVTGTSTLAVPGPSYWDGTAAHFYINAPGVSSSEGCVWGDSSKPIGNWSPYVAGANTDSTGQTFVKIAWNPEYTQSSSLTATKPTFGVKIECPDGGCNGLPCSINPQTDGLGVESPVGTVGVGDAAFCVVTVPKGSSANIVVFNTDGSTGTVSSSTSVHSTSSSTSSSSTSTSLSSTSTSSSTLTTSSTSTTVRSKSSPAASSALIGAIFHENSTVTTTSHGSPTPTTTLAPSKSDTSEAAPASTTSKNEAGVANQGGAAVLGLIVAFVAAAALY